MLNLFHCKCQKAGKKTNMLASNGWNHCENDIVYSMWMKLVFPIVANSRAKDVRTFGSKKQKKKKKHLLLHPLQKKRITSRRFQVQKMSEMLENRPQNLQHLRKFVCVQELRLMFSCLPFMNCIFYCCEFISHYFPFYFQNKVISVDESEKKRMFWVRFRKCSLQHLNGKISNDEGNEHCFCETEMFLVEHRSSILCIGQWRLTFRIGMLEK